MGAAAVGARVRRADVAARAAARVALQVSVHDAVLGRWAPRGARAPGVQGGAAAAVGARVGRTDVSAHGAARQHCESVSTTPYSVVGHAEAHAPASSKVEPSLQSVHVSDARTSQLTSLQARRAMAGRAPAAGAGVRARGSAGGRVVSSCITGSSIAAACSPRSMAAVNSTTPPAASCRAASPAAPSPPPARLAPEQRSIPRRPRPRRVELRHRQLHRRRLLASQQSSGRPHDAHGRVVSSCITGSSLAAVCLLRSRAAVDPTTPMAAPRRAASPAAPSPPPARLVAEQRSVPRRPWPRRVELHHRQLHCRRLLASQQSSGRSHDAHGRVVSSCIAGSSTTAACSPRSRAAVDPRTPMAASRRAASPAAPSPPSARFAAEQRSIPRRPWPRPVELQHRQLHRRRLPASHQSSGRSHDAHGRVVSSCITGSSIAAACSPRSRAAVDSTTPMAASRRAASPAAPSPPPARLAAERRSILDAHGRDVSSCITGSSIAAACPPRTRAAVDPKTPMAASRRAASPAAPSPPPARLAAEQRSIPRRPWPRRVELHHRQLHRRRLLASQRSSGRSHDAHGRVPSSCSTGSSIAAACPPRTRAAVDPTTPMAASCRAAAPAAPSPPPARLAAERRSILDAHGRDVSSCITGSSIAPPARLAAERRSIPRRPRPRRVELHHRQLHRRRLLASQQSSGRSHDAHGRVASSCINGGPIIAAACSPRSRAAVDASQLAVSPSAICGRYRPPCLRARPPRIETGGSGVNHPHRLSQEAGQTENGGGVSGPGRAIHPVAGPGPGPGLASPPVPPTPVCPCPARVA